nr:hypothetical protein [uncultured bacterium]
MLASSKILSGLFDLYVVMISGAVDYIIQLLGVPVLSENPIRPRFA